MRVYISGKITGTDDYNERFQKAENDLKRLGHTPANPVKICSGMNNATHEEYMRRCLKVLVECDGIYLLPGYENSQGARLEKYIADSIGMSIITIKVLPKVPR